MILVTPATSDIAIVRGDTFAQTIRVREKSTAGIVTPLDLTDWTTKMQVRKSRDGSLVTEFSDGTGITTDGPNGALLLRIESAETALLDCATYSYDLEITNPNDQDFRRTLLRGKLTVLPQITI